MSEVEVKGTTSNLVPLTAQIVSAFVKRNQVAANELQGVIQSVFRALESARRNPKHPLHQWSRAVSPGGAYAFLRLSNTANPKE